MYLHVQVPYIYTSSSVESVQVEAAEPRHHVKVEQPGFCGGVVVGHLGVESPPLVAGPSQVALDCQEGGGWHACNGGGGRRKGEKGGEFLSPLWRSRILLHTIRTVFEFSSGFDCQIKLSIRSCAKVSTTFINT